MNIYIICILIILVLYYFNSYASIDDIWLINLDKDKTKLNSLLSQEIYLPKKINRWNATYGKEEDRINAANDGVHYIISRSNSTDENTKSTKILSKPGEIGCWLSHKRLLKFLNNQYYPYNHGHLILEDDCIVDRQFIKKWNIIRKTIPINWDIVYLGIGDIQADDLNMYIKKWKNTDKWGNSGTFAYIVRHRAIPYILEQLKFMNSPIDVQYFYMLGKLNIYIVDPPLIKTDIHVKSSIDEQQIRE
jgi:GR25 family glycosyltransferase involved in LPS biosynthesis